MKTFYNLLLACYNKKLDNWNVNKSIFHDLFQQNDNDLVSIFSYLNEILYQEKSQLLTHEERIKLKYKQLDVVGKGFSTISSKKKLYEYFHVTQKRYFALLRFLNRCKWKISSVKVNTDISGNELIIGHENTIQILHENSIYYFSVSDIINICKNALLHTSFSFFSNPKIPLNPYTNRPFRNHHFFQFYWKVKKSDYKMPIYFQLFYNCFFDVEMLNYKYEHVLRSIYIKEFISTSPVVTLRTKILNMLKVLKPHGSLCIDDDFPNKVLLPAMKPFLYLFLTWKYSLHNCDETQEAKNVLHEKYKQFFKYNPVFGRKILKRVPYNAFVDKEKKVKFRAEFKTDYLPFGDIKLKSTDNDDDETRSISSSSSSEEEELFVIRHVQHEELESLQSDSSESTLHNENSEERSTEVNIVDTSSESSADQEFSSLINELLNSLNEENS